MPNPSNAKQPAAKQPEITDVEEQIRRRAYNCYEQRGRADGHDLDDWLQAEAEVRQTKANAA